MGHLVQARNLEKECVIFSDLDVPRALTTSFQDFVWAVMPPKRDKGVRTVPETHVPAMYIVRNQYLSSKIHSLTDNQDHL